jgi:hypothetical protein
LAWCSDVGAEAKVQGRGSEDEIMLIRCHKNSLTELKMV